ncbi:MAG: 23S rRNA (uracil(1939)-C(5))-methyltransferase RlmD, partial [Ruminococcus sp.]|nr:23S rRNA (uracil(1939)-C(5))-methyltransferase RlmD [Ruminococcus sp.]
MLKKNDIIELTITGLTNEGSGIGRHEGIAVFVPLTAVGDVISCRIVKVKSSYCYGIIDRILTPSPDRCDSGCGIFGRCGGCSLRHISYGAELIAKQQIVRDAFERIGGLQPEFHDILGAEQPDRYRNKAQFPVSADENGRLYAGFYARRSHRAIETTDCPLLPKVFSEICSDILGWCSERGVTAYDEVTGEGLLRHIFLRRGVHSGEIMVGLIVTSADCAELFRSPARELARKYPGVRSVILNINSRRTNAILGERVIPLLGGDRIYATMCWRRIAISLHSFYQINTVQAERVYRLAAELAGLSGGETLLDLYCGAGTIGLSMS